MNGTALIFKRHANYSVCWTSKYPKTIDEVEDCERHQRNVVREYGACGHHLAVPNTCQKVNNNRITFLKSISLSQCIKPYWKIQYSITAKTKLTTSKINKENK